MYTCDHRCMTLDWFGRLTLGRAERHTLICLSPNQDQLTSANCFIWFNQLISFVTRKYGPTDSVSIMTKELGWNSLQERRFVGDRFVQRQCVMYKAHNQLTQYALPPYCKAPTRPLRSHHLHSYQTIRAMHDPYLYSYLPSTLRVWSILPAQIACAPSLECFKFRIVTAFATGTIVIVPPKSLGHSTGAATAGQLLYVC